MIPTDGARRRLPRAALAAPLRGRRVVFPTPLPLMQTFRLPSSARRAAVVAALALPAALGAQQGTRQGAFIVRLGADTMIVERYVRTPTKLETWSVNRQPATISRHAVVTLARGVPTRLEYEGGRVDGSQPPSKVTMEIGADTTRMRGLRGDSVVAQANMALEGGGVPYIPNTFALMELMIGRFLATKMDSGVVAILPVGAPQPAKQAMKRLGKNQVAVDYFGDWMIATLDARGRLLSVDGSKTTNKIHVTRVANVDVAALTQDFAARDKAGRGMGAASPRDTARATIGAATLLVDYGRPSVRGRTLLGGELLPYDKVWRTGANAATTFVTSADLDIGGTTVPAGTYTLFTLPTKDGWTLIVNRQTKQWGTDYDQSQDLARIPLKVDPATNGPEQFTIAIEPGTGNSGTMRLLWGNVALSVPVVVKQ